MEKIFEDLRHKVVTHEADNQKNTLVDIEAFDNTAYGARLNERLAECMGKTGKWSSLLGSLGSQSQVQWADGGVFGAFAQGGGTGSANIDINGVISGAKAGATVLTIGSGDATVTSNALVSAGELGLGGSNIGTGNVIITSNANIHSDGGGIAALKAGTYGSVTVNVNADVSGLSGIASGGDGVLVVSSTAGFGAVDVNIADNVSVQSEKNGINVVKLTGDGDVTITLGETTKLHAGLIGINGATLLGDGNVAIKTGKGSSVRATVGIAATRGVGTGDVNVSLGEDNQVNAYIGVIATNLADNGAVNVMLNKDAAIIAERTGVDAASLGDIVITADTGTDITALYGQAILAEAAGAVNITTAGKVYGEGTDTTAVVSIRSGDGAEYHNLIVRGRAMGGF